MIRFCKLSRLSVLVVFVSVTPASSQRTELPPALERLDLPLETDLEQVSNDIMCLADSALRDAPGVRTDPLPTGLPQCQQGAPPPLWSITGGDEADSDGDGRVDRNDACPGTHPATEPIFLGCSGIEIARRPELLLDRAFEPLYQMADDLGEGNEFASVRSGIDDAKTALERATAVLRAGEPCEAQRIYGNVRSALESAEVAMERATAARISRLFAVNQRSRGDDHGDATAEEVEITFERLREHEFAKAVMKAKDMGVLFASVCSEVEDSFQGSGTVTKVDDAMGLLELAAGQVVALPASVQAEPLFEGEVVEITGSVLRDGSIIGQLVIPSVVSDAADLFPIHYEPITACLLLRIAPVQPDEVCRDEGQPFILHPKTGYGEIGGPLVLEKGARFGVENVGCPTDQFIGSYGMQIDIAQGPDQETIAWNLRPGDNPAHIPGWVRKDEPVTVTERVFRQICVSPFGPVCMKYPYRTSTWEARLQPNGSLASIVYDLKRFGVTDNGLQGDWEWTRVIIPGLHGVPNTDFRRFWGMGWEVTGGDPGVSSRPVLRGIELGDRLAIYEDDFHDPYDTEILFHCTGVSKPAGIMWPTVWGERNGFPYWYSATPPDLVRDVVDFCAAAEDSFYKLPLSGGYPSWQTSKGNWDDPLARHTDKDGESQSYAYDFVADEGFPILAARGGVVKRVVEEYDFNSWGVKPCKEDKCVGNWIHVRHEDGSFGAYVHIEQFGVHVVEGQRIHRGDHIADVGNTGNSSEPHLHFEAGPVCTPQLCPGSPYNSHRTRFEVFTMTTGDLPWLYVKDKKLQCHVPRAGELLHTTQ